MIPTWGSKVLKYDLLWAIWSPRVLVSAWCVLDSIDAQLRL